jgi:putative membrane protein
MKQIVSDSDRSLLDRRIAETEKATGAQIVLASVVRSDSYAEIPWKAFAMGASVASLLILYLDLFVLGWLTEILVVFSVSAVLISGILLAVLSVLFTGFARLFLSSRRKETETLQYAESLFLSNELFSTEGRSGILVLVSQFERQVVILPDKGIRDQLSMEVLNGIIS